MFFLVAISFKTFVRSSGAWRRLCEKNVVILMTNVCEKKKRGNEGSRSPYDGVLGDFLDGRIIADILIAGDKGVKEV